MSVDLAHYERLDQKLVAAARGVKLLSQLSWPGRVRQRFLDRWRRGKRGLPKVEYPRLDYSVQRAELEAIAEACEDEHPIGHYLRRTAESYAIAMELLESMGSDAVTEHSVRLYGKPGDVLPGSDHDNLDAARHFIAYADELAQDSPEFDVGTLPAEVLRDQLDEVISRFFTGHEVAVVVDADLVAKAAAGPTRIRLRADTLFSEDDRAQLIEHEAFVHTLTSLNGRGQPHLRSLGLNSPRITATQEGLATFAELITGAIDIVRLKRISLRILAIDLALKGADFIDVFGFFLDSGQSDSESFTSAMRVFRGVPVHGGAAFTKDTVYLHGLLSVHTFFRMALKQRRFELCRNLFAGKMTLFDAIRMQPHFESGWVAAPRYLPPWMQRANGVAGVLAFSLFANRIRLDRVEQEYRHWQQLATERS